VGTIGRAGEVPPALLHERVDGEWSFVETLRHLLFVTDAWASRALLGVPSPYHPLDLPPTGMRNAALPRAQDVHPPLGEVLVLRGPRVEVVRDVMTGLTDDALASGEVRVRGAGYPRPGTYPVRRCVQALVGEEWYHRQYAERDLDVLERRT
jgi:hypothetical protein